MDSTRRGLSPGGSAGGGAAIADGHAPDLLAERVLEVIPQVMHRIRHTMREGAAPGLSIPQFRVLRLVSRNPGIGVSGVADRLGMSVTATSALVDRLVRAGELERSRDTEERRRVRLALSPAGEDRIARAYAATRAWLADEVSNLEPRDRDELAAALDILSRLGSSERR